MYNYTTNECTNSQLVSYAETQNYREDKSAISASNEEQTHVNNNNYVVDSFRFSPLLANPKYPQMANPIIITRPIFVIYNPVAGGGKPRKYVEQLQKEIGKMPIDKQPKVHILQTLEDPKARITTIVKYIESAVKQEAGKGNPLIISFGGDKTCENATEVALRLKAKNIDPDVVYGRGGTAGDVSKEMGMPRKVGKLLRAIPKATKIKLNIIKSQINGKGPYLIILHSQGNGYSGAFFSGVEDAAKEPKGKTLGVRAKALFRPGPYSQEVASLAKIPMGKSIPAYLQGLFKGLSSAETFYVSVNGGKPMPVAEVLTLATSTRVGSVAIAPLPLYAGQMHAIPVDPSIKGFGRLKPGLKVLGESLLRGAKYSLGDQSVLIPTRVASLPADRIFEIHPETTLNLKFFDAKGNPKAVKGVINGDAIKGIKSVQIKGTNKTVNVLATKDSAIMVRRSMAISKTLYTRLTASVDKTLNSMGFSTGLILIGAFEIYKDAMGFTPEQNASADRNMLVGAVLADAFTVNVYGAPSFFMQAPYIMPFFVSGQVITSEMVNKVAEDNGVQAFKSDRAANTISGLLGGALTSYAAIRWIRPEVIEAGGKSVNDFLVRNVSREGAVKAGVAIRNFATSTARFMGAIKPMVPVIIVLPPSMLEPQEEENKFI